MKQITKQEAAERLGCAERQIQRYTQAGRLTVEYVQEGKIRKAMYNAAEVDALKQQLAAPEVRGIAVRPPQISEGTPQASEPTPQTTDNRQLTTTNPLALPVAAQQVLSMLGAASAIEAGGKCVAVEEMSFEKLSVGADGSTRMAGVKIARYSARA